MIEYRSQIDGLTAADFDGFCVGWPRPLTGLELFQVLDAAYAVEVALRNGAVVGFINAISDGVLSAFIPLLEVRPEYQGQNIGLSLTNRMLDRLSNLYSVDLVCDPDIAPFYDKVGMLQVVGYARRNKLSLH